MGSYATAAWSAVQVQYFLNISRLQSDACDLTERAAFSIGLCSVKVCKYSNYSVQFRFVLCDFEKYGSGSVKVRQQKRKTGLQNSGSARFPDRSKPQSQSLMSLFLVFNIVSLCLEAVTHD